MFADLSRHFIDLCKFAIRNSVFMIVSKKLCYLQNFLNAPRISDARGVQKILQVAYLMLKIWVSRVRGIRIMIYNRK